MAGLTTLKTVAVISAISSTCQGLVWSVISLLAILTYSCTLMPDPVRKNTHLTYKHYLAAYFQGSCDANLDIYKDVSEMTASGGVLVISIFVYAFNLLFTIGSITVLVALFTNKRPLILGWLICYVVIGFCVSTIDIVACTFVASDYDYVSKSPSVTNREMAGLTLMSVFVITSRGIFLWIANMFFYIYITACLLKTKSKRHPARKETPSMDDETDASFQFDRTDLERPIEFVEKNRERLGHEYPEHCAYSRWPKLHPGNRLVQGKDQNNLQESKPSQQAVNLQQQPPPQPYNVRYSQTEPHRPRPTSIYPETSLQQRPYDVQIEAQKVRSTATYPEPLPYDVQKVRPTAVYPEPPQQPYDPRYVQTEPHRARPTAVYPENRPRPVIEAKPSNSSSFRPGSLQEAILTVRPLRQVRPNISAISEGYP